MSRFGPRVGATGRPPKTRFITDSNGKRHMVLNVAPAIRENRLEGIVNHSKMHHTDLKDGVRPFCGMVPAHLKKEVPRFMHDASEQDYEPMPLNGEKYSMEHFHVNTFTDPPPAPKPAPEPVPKTIGERLQRGFERNRRDGPSYRRISKKDTNTILGVARVAGRSSETGEKLSVKLGRSISGWFR